MTFVRGENNMPVSKISHCSRYFLEPKYKSQKIPCGRELQSQGFDTEENQYKLSIIHTGQGQKERKSLLFFISYYISYLRINFTSWIVSSKKSGEGSWGMAQWLLSACLAWQRPLVQSWAFQKQRRKIKGHEYNLPRVQKNIKIALFCLSPSRSSKTNHFSVSYVLPEKYLKTCMPVDIHPTSSPHISNIYNGIIFLICFFSLNIS